MSTRDQQLYPNSSNVHALTGFLLHTKALSRLLSVELLTTQRAATRALSDKVKLWNESMPADDICATELTGWVKAHISRDGWKKIKQSFARRNHSENNKLKRIDLKPDTLTRLKAVKAELGFASYDEVLDYLLSEDKNSIGKD